MNDINETQITMAAKELKAASTIVKILKKVSAEKRLRILRAACILATGQDLSELLNAETKE